MKNYSIIATLEDGSTRKFDKIEPHFQMKYKGDASVHYANHTEIQDAVDSGTLEPNSVKIMDPHIYYSAGIGYMRNLDDIIAVYIAMRNPIKSIEFNY